MLPETGAMDVVMGEFCYALPHTCTFFQEGFFDWEDDIDNSSRVADKNAHAPQGAGWRNLVHYAQIIASKQFQRYDFGRDGNREKYGQDTPPLYDLSAITVPMAFAHGDVDQLADTTDVEWLMNESDLSSKELLIFHKEYHFGHSSFMMANDMTYFSLAAIEIFFTPS